MLDRNTVPDRSDVEDVEADALAQKTSGFRGEQVRVLDVDDRTALAEYSCRERLDVVLNGQEQAARSESFVNLAEHALWVGEVIENLKETDDVETVALEETRSNDV